MRNRNGLKFLTGVLALALVQSGAAFAGTVPVPEVPAPGILGLVALGVIGAILVARHRK